MTTIISDIPSWRQRRKTLEGSLGFVPTMGNLHEGHLSLCRRALDENDHVVVSIFINPTQFNQKSDYEKYQRTLESDRAMLEDIDVDYIFHPDADSMYPDHYEVQVKETAIANELEGHFRPGHFTGMMTVVLKLLNIIQADRAYFGEKDFQQLLLVKKMAEAFFLPVEIIGCPTIRAEDGLALSSRNARLDEELRRKSSEIHRLIGSAADDAEVISLLKKSGFKPEYVEKKWGRRLAAVWAGDVRLIDNVPLDDATEEKEK